MPITFLDEEQVTPGKRKITFIDEQSAPVDTIKKNQPTFEEYKPQPFSLGKTISNIPKSAYGLGRAIVEPLISPIQTGKALYGLASGLVQRIVPGEQDNEKYVNAVGDMLLERYGSVDNLKKTVQNDPVGVVSDLSTLVTGIGSAGKLGTVTKVGQAIEPVSGAMKLGGQALKVIGEKIGKPFAAAVKPEVMATAVKYGIDVPASTVSKSSAVNILESGSLKGLFSKSMLNKVNTAETKINQLADDLVKGTGAVADPYIVGNKIIDNFGDFRKNWFQLKDELYNKAIIDRGIPAEVSDTTLKYLEDIIQTKKEAKSVLGESTNLKYFEDLYGNLSKEKNIVTGEHFTTHPDKMRNLKKGYVAFKEDGKVYSNKIGENEIYNHSDLAIKNNLDFDKAVPGFLDKNNNFIEQYPQPLDAKDIQSSIRELNKKIGNPLDPITTGNKAELKKIATLLSQDLDNTLVKTRPDLKQAIDEANSVYKSGLDTMNSTWGKIINKYKNNPEKVSKILTNKDLSVDQLPEIMKVLGNDMKPDVQALVLNDIFSNARSKTRIGEPLTSASLTKGIKDFGDAKLQMVLDPKQYETLKDIEVLVKNFNEGQKLAGGSQTGFINRMMGTLAVLTVSPLTALKMIVGDGMYSKFIASPAGQKWLTTGYELGKPGQLLKQVGQVSAPITQPAFQIGRISQMVQDRLNR